MLSGETNMNDPNKSHMPSPRSGAPNRRETASRLLYKRTSGQVAIIVALSILVLMGIIGLAVDAGAAYAQRRAAQNSADATALAATRVMLDAYMAMVADNPDGDIDGSPETDDAIRTALNDYATLHGVDPSALQAYYVTDSKQVIGDGNNLLEVGNFGLV